MSLKHTFAATALACSFALASAGPELSLSGYLDAEVYTNFDGSFISNQELDLGLTLTFSKAVSVNLYVTVLSGLVPAGPGGGRWAAVTFDGLDLTFETPLGTFAVGDLVYQYGGFDYYGYKRLSMITPESFTRGLSFTFGGDKVTQTIIAGAADDETTFYIIDETGTATDEPAFTATHSADLVGATEFSLGDALDMGVYYGLRIDARTSFAQGGSLFGGLEITAEAGPLALHAAASYNRVGENNFFSVLLEPLLSAGDFSTALSFYFAADLDKSGLYPTGVEEDLFVYLEPGYAFNDFFAFGIPLEYHAGALDDDRDDAIWIVPTAYFTPFTGVEWWVWAGATIGVGANTNDPGFSLGSEIIIEF